MKILLISPLYPPYIGGLEEHVSKISECLASRHDVNVFTTDPSGKLKKIETVNGVNIRRFSAFAPNNAYFISFEMLKAIKDTTFDIIHSHNYHALTSGLAKFSHFKKLIVTPHYHGHGSTRFRDLLLKCYKPFGRALLKEANYIVCISNHEKNLIIQDFNIDDKRIKIIPNGINLEEFGRQVKKNKKEQDENLTILYVSRLEKYKGIQYAIQALAQLDKKIHLEIVGSGVYEKELRKLSNKLNVQNRITFIHSLQRHDLINKYSNADLVLLLSQYEGFGLVIEEALASSTPCIVTNTSALTEWIDNKNCFGIDYPVNIESLVRLMKKVIGIKVETPDLLDWSDITQQLESLYLH